MDPFLNAKKHHDFPMFSQCDKNRFLSDTYTSCSLQPGRLLYVSAPGEDYLWRERESFRRHKVKW